MKLVFALLLLPALALAQPPLEKLEALKLTDTQRTKIETLRDAERRKAIPLEADVRLAEMDLEDAIEQGGATGPIVDRIASLRGQMLAARVATRVAVRAVLTPEQRAKLKTMRPEGPPGPPR